jgi:hypothetical protein
MLEEYICLISKKYILGSIDHRPDVYLDQIQAGLRDTCGVEVSLPTIWRTLERSGFTMKKVCPAILV